MIPMITLAAGEYLPTYSSLVCVSTFVIFASIFLHPNVYSIRWAGQGNDMKGVTGHASYHLRSPTAFFLLLHVCGWLI